MVMREIVYFIACLNLEWGKTINQSCPFFFSLISPYFLNNKKTLKQTPNNKFRVHLVVLLESTFSIESVFEEKSDTWQNLENIFKKLNFLLVVLLGEALDRCDPPKRTFRENTSTKNA